MAGKRSASSDLNHDNWDHDEIPENAGIFQRASEESLKRRIIKTARRRNPISSVRSVNPEETNAFTNFKAFSKTGMSTAPGFTFSSNTTGQTDIQKSNGTSEITDASVVPSSVSKDTNGKSNEYFSKLKGLNESVSGWIKKHVDTNPFINLQPIFKDYGRYFKDLEKHREFQPPEEKQTEGNERDEKISSINMFVFKSEEAHTIGKVLQDPDKINSNKNTKSSLGLASISKYTTDSKTSFGCNNTAVSNTFSFASANISTSTMSTLSPSFSFKSNISTSGNENDKLSGSTPFTFSNVSTEKSNKETEEEDEPPKVEFIPVVEKGYIFTTRCKVFIKKDNGFGDRGVGNLYLKPIENCNKVQCIVRADTNLGNLLCNFILSKNIPTKRMGKKDVMLVCLPMPDIKPPPIPILLRVKSPDEADTLLEVLEKHKN